MENNFYQMINPISILFAIGITFLVSYVVGKNLNISGSFIGILYLWHLIFMLVYLWFVSDYGGDIIGYWNDSFTNRYDFTPGTKFVVSLVKIFSVLLGFDFISTNIIFMSFGVFAILLLTRIYFDIFQNLSLKCQIFPIVIVFFPSLSYWSSSIGKDGLALLSCTLSLYYFSQINKRFIIIFLALLIMVFIRAYVALPMALAITITFFFILNKSFHKILTLFGLALIFLLGLIFLPKVLGLSDDFSFYNINLQFIFNLFESRKNYNLDGISSYNIINFSILEMILTFMYAPIFVNSLGIFGMLASIENLILICFLLLSFLGLKHYRFHIKNPSFIYSFIFFNIMILMFSYTTTNMGIAMRQKTMLLPFYFYLTCISIAFCCSRNVFCLRRLF